VDGGKRPRDLKVSEGAYLLGAINAPSSASGVITIFSSSAIVSVSPLS
jgi:hypothetical protein